MKISDVSLTLSVLDTPDFLDDTENRMFLVSVMGYNLDTRNKTFVISTNSDFISTAKIIKETYDYLTSRGFVCTTDKKCNDILAEYQKSQNNFYEISKTGSTIRKEEQSIPKLSKEFKRKLMPYQRKSVEHMIKVGYSANFSVPGSGKTTITYAAFFSLRESGIINKMLVIGPRSSFMSWEDEFEGCFGRKPISLRLDGNSIKNIVAKSYDKDIVLCTYQMMSLNIENIIKFLKEYETLLVLDESHNIKKISGGSWAPSVLKLSPYAKRRVILTGTPLPNSVKDLWSQITFIWLYKDIFDESTVFEKYVDKHGLGKYKERLDPFYIRIKKDDLGLKKPVFRRVYVPLSKNQASIYKSIAKKTLDDIENFDEKSKLQVWRKNKIIRLMQSASNPSLLTEYSSEFRIPPMPTDGIPVSDLIKGYTKYEMPSKLVCAAKIAKEIIESGNKVIIWTAFVHNIITLKNGLLRDFDPLVVYGDVPKDENENEQFNRDMVIKEFKNDTKPRILIATPNSCAESVSLHKNDRGETVCKNSIYLDRTFNAGHYMQSLDRIHRIGLDPRTEVEYIILIGKNTIDEVIDKRLDEKILKMFDALNDDFTPLDLEKSASEILDNDLEEDFRRTYEHLKKIYGDTNDI